ncbi:MAG: sigma-70 family RNA polymerase sigma factor [Gammaproteobacteria bacterium]
MARRGQGFARSVPAGSDAGAELVRVESGTGEYDSTDVKSPLDLYCAEIRRLKRRDTEDEQSLQEILAEVSNSLVRTISGFPGSARSILDDFRGDPGLPSAARNDRESQQVGFSSEPQIEDLSDFDTEYCGKADDRVLQSTFLQGNSDVNLLQPLAACWDQFDQAARQHGIAHETTRQWLAALADAFCRLPWSPYGLKVLVRRLNSVMADWQQDPTGNLHRADLANYCAEDAFEQRYAIRFEEFRQIVREASKLFRKWQRTRNRIAEFHVGLVVYLARQYSSEPQELIDLIQEGNIGLIKAVERFNYRLGFRFSTYATYWIRLAMSRYLARSSRVVRLPYRHTLHIGTVRKKRESFTQTHGRPPSMLELARDTGISEAGLRKLETLSQAIASLNAPLESSEGLDLMSLFEQQTFSQPVEVLERERREDLIGKAIDTLNQREAFVIRQRFGIGVYAEKTLQELGSLLGLTRERVRQIESGALKKMRRWLEPLAA